MAFTHELRELNPTEAETRVNDTGKKRIIRGDLIETAKTMTGMERVDKHDMQSKGVYNLRVRKCEVTVKSNCNPLSF